METVVLSLHLLIALALIVAVLLQRSEGGGLGIGGGSGGVVSGRGAATALSKLTWGLGAAFVVTSLALTVIAARGTGTDSVIDRLGTSVGEAPGPVLPGLEDDDLLPPIPIAPSAPNPAPPIEGPSAPPAVE